MRASGVLMPVSSIPSDYGIGCFSKEAYEFVDQLAEAGQKYWQILPLGPTGYGDSPYQSCSTFAGNPYFIDLGELIRENLLTEEECSSCDWGDNPSYVDYEKIYNSRFLLLRKAYDRAETESNEEYQKFLKQQNHWIWDYALFMAIKDSQKGISWAEWPREFQDHDSDAVKKARQELDREVGFYCFQQYLFHRQWMKLKEYANQKGIGIIGDVPIYVAPDSADAWADPGLFQFDENYLPVAVAGCPPDAFSATGQLWGNPLYDWKKHKEEGYFWWTKRMLRCMELYDIVRIDHFRGFDEYYSIPYGDKTAEKGHWEKGPGLELFHVLNSRIDSLQVIAEDLGFLTESVLEMVRESGYPGMKVLQFAFDGSAGNPYLPYKYDKNCVVYTGTHDNETTKGWMEHLNPHDAWFIRAYTDCENRSLDECVWGLIRAAQSSTADLCVIPIQDYLCLGNEARMNEPSTLGDNWKWRLQKEQLSYPVLERMRALTGLYGRA